MAQEKSVLMIGNSFSISVGKQLPQMVAAEGKHRLSLTSLYIGGCSLRRHSENLKKVDADSTLTPYRRDLWNNGKRQTGSSSANVELKRQAWDVVTIQQASHESWDYANYQPFADTLMERIRKDAQGAEILIQQTWSYHASDRRFAAGGWGFDQDGMYSRLAATYEKLARKYALRQIPTGLAIQKARALGMEPVNSGADTIHLNPAGEYLQACVWYGALFGEDPERISYRPDFLSEADARKYRTAAAQALRELPQAR